MNSTCYQSTKSLIIRRRSIRFCWFLNFSNFFQLNCQHKNAIDKHDKTSNKLNFNEFKCFQLIFWFAYQHLIAIVWNEIFVEKKIDDHRNNSNFRKHQHVHYLFALFWMIIFLTTMHKFELLTTFSIWLFVISTNFSSFKILELKTMTIFWIIKL